MDKMRFLKVLSIKMGVFMDKIEFFLYIAEPSGSWGPLAGRGWWGLGRRGRGGNRGGRGQGHRLRRARHRRRTAGGRQREGNGGRHPEGGRERATAEDSRKEAERGNGGGAREEEV